MIKVVIYLLVYNSFLWKGSTFLYIGLTFEHFRLSGKYPVFNIWLTQLIYDSFYGFYRYMVKWKFAFNFEVLLYCFYSLSVKGKFFTTELIVWFPGDIEVFADQLKRFNESVIDPKCLLKIAATSFCFDNNFSFQARLLRLLLFTIRFTCFPKWFGIIINTTFLKLPQFGLFIQIFQRSFVVT